LFDVRVCHPNVLQGPGATADLSRPLKRQEARRVLNIEHSSFTPLVFTITGGMEKECIRYHSLLAELIAIKENITRKQFPGFEEGHPLLLRLALVCLRGSRVKRGTAFDYNNFDIKIAVAEGPIDNVWSCVLAALHIYRASVLPSALF